MTAPNLDLKHLLHYKNDFNCNMKYFQKTNNFH